MDIVIKSPIAGKTFNNHLGSPLAKLHHKDKWFSYLRCRLNSLTLRESAKQIGIDLKVAFRYGVSASLLHQRQPT
ncbi:MAG: hypothetical protein ACTS73_04785 [Arsenophonus sp. NEOnobi-MAG3]